MKKRKTMLSVLLAFGIFSTASGTIHAENEIELTEYIEEESEISESEPTDEEEIKLTVKQAEKLYDKIGTADGYTIYKRYEDYDERFSDDEISLIKEYGELVITDGKSQTISDGFFRGIKSEVGMTYISDTGKYLLETDENTSSPKRILEAVCVADDEYLFKSKDGKSLELRDDDFTEIIGEYKFTKRQNEFLIYSSESGEESAWISLDKDRAYGIFRTAAENNKYKMLCDSRRVLIGLENNETGYIWWSSPLDASQDETATPLIINELKSSAVVRYGIPEKRNSGNWLRSNTSDCDIKVTETENGIRAEYNYSRAGIKFPVEYTLEADCMKAELKISEITESSKSTLATEITLLGGFGAGSSDEEGYFVIPDGSGALIRFNNGKTQKGAYSRRVYGDDVTAVPSRKISTAEQIYLPMYGIVKENNGMLVVASKGDSNANLNASVAGMSNSGFNLCNFSFILRNTDSFYMSGNLNEEITVFESGEIDSDDIELRYYPISGEDISYSDIASEYRKYLANETGVQPKTTSDAPPLYIDFYGGTEKKTPVMGIPITLNKSVTGYSEARRILNRLANSGADSMVVSYKNWTEDGIEGKIDTDASYCGTLGSRSDFKELKKFMSDNGTEFYPTSENREFNSGNGYYSFTDTAVRVSGSYARTVSYDRAYGIPDGLRENKSLLSPKHFKSVFSEAADNYFDSGLNGISLGTLTSSLYGDYGKKHISRYDSMQMLIESYEEINSVLTNGILAEGANAYAFPYLIHITDVPQSSGGFDIFDEDIPLLQLVLHGVIPYSTKAVNGSADSEKLFMQAVSTGSGLNFDFIYADASELKDTELDEYFYANYSWWADTAVKEYQLMSEILYGLGQCTISEYKISADGKQAETIYSDGTVIKTDFDAKTIERDGKLYELRKYEEEGGVNF